ncbi:MAG: ATP-binding protein [Clostridiaceae bacterium]|nr:ATP-binding protein [Clostridiaceae bacterium]
MTWNKDSIEKIVIISIATILMGQIYINPVSGVFRLSMAVAMISVLLIYFEKAPVILVCSIIALFIPFFRAFIHFIAYHNMTFWQTLSYYSPVAIYYILYGFLFRLLDIRKKLDAPLLFIISLWVCDSIPNIAEALYRQMNTSSDFSSLVLRIILVGFARSVFICLLYYLSKYYKGRYDRKQKESKYREMVFFISSLKSELFFLRKSMVDIEGTMQMSYELYRELRDKELKERALTISKNVHEIKKDYYRVVSGMEKVLSKESEKTSMELGEIFDIVRENCGKIISSRGKDISLDFRHEDDFRTEDFYSLISVLNNFIINSIDAIEGNGRILVEEENSGNEYVFRVIDNGIGIEGDEMEMLFEPGYSTKYDPVTGRMSTGIGLSHVKQIIENYFEGSVHIDSSKIERRTCCEVRIPKGTLS